MNLNLAVKSGEKATEKAEKHGIINAKGYHVEKEKNGITVYVASFRIENIGHHKYAKLVYFPWGIYGNPEGQEPTEIKNHRVKIY